MIYEVGDHDHEHIIANQGVCHGRKVYLMGVNHNKLKVMDKWRL